MLQDNTQSYKEDLFYSYVHNEPVRYPQSTDGKLIDVIMVIEQPLKGYIKNFHQYARHIQFKEFEADMVTEFYELIKVFDNPTGNWEGLIERTDKEAHNKFLAYIKKSLKFFAMNNYKEGYRTTKTVNTKEGKKKVYQYVKPTVSSLDDVLINKDGTEAESLLVETITNNYWDAKADYQANAFYSWYKQNYKRILTKNQVSVLEELEKFGYCKEDKKSRELMQYSNITVNNLPKKLDRIKERILKAWNKEKHIFTLSNAEQILYKRLSLLQNLMSIVNDDSCINGQNKQISDFIKGNIDSGAIESIIDQLTTDEEKEVIYAIQHKQTIISEVLYKIVLIAEEMIEELELKLVHEREIKKQQMEREGIVNENIDDEPEFYTGSSTIYLTLLPTGAVIQE